MSEFRQAWRVDAVRAENLQDYLNEISRLGMAVRDLQKQGSPASSTGDTILVVSFKNVKPQGFGMAVQGIKRDQEAYRERIEVTGTLDEVHIKIADGVRLEINAPEDLALLAFSGGSTSKSTQRVDESSFSDEEQTEPGIQADALQQNNTSGFESEANKPATSRRRVRAVKTESPSAETWRCYQRAYARRWGVEPLPNARNWTLLGQFIGRVGKDNAPRVAEFFVTHNDRLYVNAKHPLTLLLRDSDKIYAEWRTGRQSSATESNQNDRRSNNLNAMQEFLKGDQ